MRRRLAVATVLAVVAAACSSSPGASTSSTASRGEPSTTTSTAPTSTTTRPALPSVDLGSGIIIDPTAANTWAAYGNGASFYDGQNLQSQPAHLYTLASPTRTLVPLLGAPAEIPSGSLDGEAWVIDVPIRDSLIWADGEPLDAHDAVFTFDTVRALGLGGAFELFWPVAGDDAGAGLTAVVAVDDRTLRLTWNRRPGLAEWEYGTALAPILPEHFWSPHVASATGAADLYAIPGSEAPGLGPRSGSYVVFENGAVEFSGPEGSESWGGAPSGQVVAEYSQPNVSSIEFTPFFTQEDVAADLLTGNIEFWLQPLALWKEVAGVQRQFVLADDVDIAASDGGGLTYVAFNTRRFPGDNLAFRQAVDCVIDKDFITSDILLNAATPIDAVVPSTNTTWHNETVASTCAGQSNGERLESAVAILEAGGWTWDREPSFDPAGDEGRGDVEPGEGLRGPGGQVVPPLELLAPNAGYDPIRATYAYWIQSFMNELGIPVKTQTISFASLTTAIEGLDWDLYLFGWSLGGEFPTHLFELFHSSNDLAVGGLNTSGYRSAGFDQGAEAFLMETDAEAARQIALRLQELIAGDVPIVPLYTNSHTFAYRDLGGISFEDLMHTLDMGAAGLPGLITRS